MADLSALKDWTYRVDVEAIAWATFDRAGESQNSLSRRALEELGAIVDEAERAAAAKTIIGLVIASGKDKGFIVGADVREFEQLTDAKMVAKSVATANALLDRIEKLPVPVICCIHGFCLGGGLELALACHYRIATRDDATRFGFPEVKLGIFPGFNGTVRSIRQAGAMAAMPMMLSGSMVRASAARAMELVDELVPATSNLTWAARKAVLRKRKSQRAGGLKALVSRWPLRGFLAQKMRSETAKKARADHYPAPFRLIDLYEKFGGSPRRMKTAETEYFAPLMVSDTSRNLRRVFMLSEMLKAQAPKGLDWKPLRVHVIGAGVMGADIAGWCVVSGMEVTLQDLSPEAIAKGCAFVAAIDKFPLITKSSPGFVVNRVLGPYMMAAMERMEKGESKENIDEAARVFGMPMGPIELADTVGLDVCAHVGKILGRSAEGSKLEALVKAGNVGKKSGRGFYVWKDGKPEKGTVTADKVKLTSLGRDLVEPLIAECEKVRDEGVVSNADLVDAGVIFGTGFAPFRGGPLHFKASEGRSNVTPIRPAQAAE